MQAKTLTLEQIQNAHEKVVMMQDLDEKDERHGKNYVWIIYMATKLTLELLMKEFKSDTING